MAYLLKNLETGVVTAVTERIYRYRTEKDAARYQGCIVESAKDGWPQAAKPKAPSFKPTTPQPPMPGTPETKGQARARKIAAVREAGHTVAGNVTTAKLNALFDAL
jgi:hypothetical protein